ncbi:MAG: hypothetical protein ACXWL2_00765 [Candidatus Chromulinivorax sp.]
MKKVLALGLATFSAYMQADQQNWNTANTFLHFETPFQTASPERVSLFIMENLREKHRAAHNGDVQFVVFGGQNSNQSDAAAYYMPGGLETLQFNASFTDANNGTNTQATYYTNGAQGGITPASFGGTSHSMAYVSAYTSPTTYTATNIALSTSAGTSGGANSLAVIPLNSSTVGQAILNSTTGAVGSVDNFVIGNQGNTAYAPYNLANVGGLFDNITSNAQIGDFVIDTNKNIGIMRPWNFGVGYAPNVQFGQPIGQSAFVSTITPELKRSQWGIGATWRQLLTDKDTGFWLELSTALQSVKMNMNLNEVVAEALVLDPQETGFGATWAGQGYDNGDVEAPTTIEQAFAQSAWNYGKVNGAQSVTRLADIELKLGYQWICEDNVMANSFLGIVIPTGNKAQSVYLAEPIVGNGFHFAIMLGSTAMIQLDSGADTRWTLRTDTSWRYLFQNTQVRSFDTMSHGQWSRYMMVWPDYATEQANGEMQTAENSLRAYTPGINVFTQEMNVKPGAQARWNNAVVLEHNSFKAEFGWNMMVRQAEEVSLVNAWQDNAVAFVDASNQDSSLYNATRTIYNDAYQSTPLILNNAAGDSQAQYEQVTVNAADLNLDSAASPAIFTNTPYLALGYAFNEEKSSVFSVGVSYEVAATNGYINDWNLWGKFSFSF